MPAGPDTVVLLADMSVFCNTASYWSFTTYVVGMIAVFSFGIPAAYFALVFLNRKRIQSEGRDMDKSIQSFRFLWGAYEPRFWYWEVVELVRKLVLAGAMVYMPLFCLCSAPLFARR